MKENIFYQDFLFEDLPVDEKDDPAVKVAYTDEFQETECQISFDRLLRMDKQQDWERLCCEIADKTVKIIDDVQLENKELEQYKKFYLASYFYIISKRCSSCVVAINPSIK